MTAPEPTPRTAAGRALLGAIQGEPKPSTRLSMILAIEAEAAALAGLREACDIIEHLIDHFVPEYAPTDSGGDVDAALTARAFLAAAYQQEPQT